MTRSRIRTGVCRTALLALLFPVVATSPANADDRHWDANNTRVGTGGDGTWDMSSPVWSPNDDGVSGPYSAWDNLALDDAFFSATPGTITLIEPIRVHDLNFVNQNGWVLNGDTLTLDGIDPTITNAGTVTINSVIAGTSGLSKAGAGTLTLTAANTFTGDINLDAGRLIAAGGASLGDIGNVVNMAAGTRLDVGTTGGGLDGRTVSFNGNVQVAGAGAGSGFFTGSGGVVTFQGVALSNDFNDYTNRTDFFGGTGSSFTSIADLGIASSLGAPTTVADGTISVRSGGQTNAVLNYVGDGDSSNRNWALNPPAGPQGEALYLRNVGTGTLTLTGDIALGGSSGNRAIFRAWTADMELLGTISSNNGRDAWFQADTGMTIRLGDANTFSGRAVIQLGGQVEAGTIADGGVASSLGAGTIVNISSSGTLSYTGAGASSDRDWQIDNGTLNNDGSGALTLNGDAAIANTATLGGSFTGADNAINGVISGTGNLRSNGDATWLLTGANTYTGQTIVDSGTLRAGTAGAVGGSTQFTVNGGTLDLNNFDQTFTTLNGTGGTLDLGSATLTLEAPTGTSATFAGSIAGTGGLTKLGGSEQTLTGASTYTGDTTVGGGTLNLDFSPVGGPANNIIGTDSTLIMSGGTLNVIGAAGEVNSQTFDGLTITGGSNTIGATSGTGGNLTVELGTITRTGGLVNFNLPDSGNITTTNTSLGGWATVNGTDYAKVEGGSILAFEEDDYTDQDNAADWLDGEFITDVDGFSGMVTDTKQLGGLRYTVDTSTTVMIDAGETLGVDGTIIVAPSVLNANQVITGGTITGSSGGTLGIQQNSTGNFTIESQIVDNGPGTGFTKAGTGLVTLANPNNTYTGGTLVAQGTLSVVSIADGGVASSIGMSSPDPSNLVLGGGTLRYTGAGDTSDRGFTIVKSGAILGAGIEVTDPNANLTFSGLVTSPDDASFTKSGPGTLTLANPANDYVGITTVTGGLLSVNTLPNGGVPSPIGQSSSDPANLVLNGGGLQYTGITATTDRGFTLGTNDGTVDITDGSTVLTVSGTIEGAGTLIKEGAGTLVLDGTTNYTGGNTVNGGVLRAGGDNTLGLVGNVGVTTVAAGATLDLNDFDNLIGPLNGAGDVTLGSGTLRIHRGNGNYSGVISGTGGIWRTGGGTQTFNGCNNTYTGSTLLQGANVSTDCLQNGGTASGIGASGSDSSNLQFNNGALIYTGNSIAIDRGFELVGGAGNIQVFDAATTLEFEGAVIGGGSLIKSGAGTLVLSGTNTYFGNTRVADGVLRAATTNAFGSQGHMTLDNTAGVLLDLDGFDTVVTSLIGGGANGGNITLGSATLTINSVDNRSYAGVISGAGNLIKNGNTIQALTGCDSSYAGSTTINAGTLQVSCLADGGSNSSIGASSSDPANLVLDGGILDYVGTGGSTNREFTLGINGGTIASNGSGPIEFSFTGLVTLDGTDTARTLTLSGDNTDTNIFSAQLDDNGTGATSLTKTGDGLWRLTNPNSTYTGITTISGGVLEVNEFADGGMASSIGAASNDAANLVIGNGSTLRYTGAGDTSDRLFTLDAGVAFIESSGNGALQFTNTGAVGLTGTDTPRTMALGGTNTGDNTFGGAIGDNGTGATTLAKNDSGTWILTGNNTYSGNTVINDGNLVIGNGGTTGNAGVGNVIVDSPTSTLSLNRSDTFTFDGTLSGPGTLAQIGSGISVLTSADNSIGATTISAGTLQVDGGLTTATVDMTGTSALTVNGTVQAGGGSPTALSGDGGVSTVTVNADAMLAANGDLGDGADTVNLAGTLATGGAALSLGLGNDTLILRDGGTITGTGVDAGAGTDALVVNNTLALSLDGASVTAFESLTKQNTGVLTLTGDHDYSAGTTVTAGTLRIGNGGLSGTLAGDIANDSTLEFNRSGTLTIAGDISGSGALNQIGTGTTILTGANSYSGPTTVDAGTLLVNGDQSAAMGLTAVASGATLGGTGIIGGDVTIAGGATLAPGSNDVGTLTINGGLSLDPGSTLEMEFGEANVVGGALNDLIEVGGDLVLDGTINVTEPVGGSFDAGVYRVINYSGSLTDNGLDLGTLPPGSDVFVQTSVANQVNLVNAGGLTLNFWDGNAGPKNNGAVNGGDGLWQDSSGNDNWTTAAGDINAPWTDSAFAIFTATPGTVTVDNSLGDVSASGMQFAIDGYTITGDALTLDEVEATIRVGDGTAAGADMTATIEAELTGSSQLAKTDLGTLVLTGANSYMGGTFINGGTLQVSEDGNLGDGTGGLAFDDGTLRTTASFTSARVVALDGAGTFLTDTGTTLTLEGAISGTGSLTKTGAGTLLLTNDSDYSGGTTILAGALQLGDGGTTGSIAGDVINDAALTFNRSDEVTFAGLVSGAGALNQIGTGTLILTGANSYMGATNVDAGTLLVNGDQSAAMGLTTVASGATLGGVGIIGGDVTFAGGATLAPGSNDVGTLTIDGALSLDGASLLDYEFGQSDVVGGPFNDLVEVGGDLVLAGTIDVTVSPGGSFDVGLYRVINYTGTLTNNDLALGTMPAGSDVFVQTSVANQVNLVNTGGLTLNFWDGDAGPKFDDAVNGGDGLWQASGGNDNWTEVTGAINAPWTDSAFAIFTATPGTVMVDNSLGDVSASGMQFAVDGYTITGDALTLDEVEATIRVGDGTAAGADMTATIEAELTGSSQLAKTDLGALILTGANSYTGGTTVDVGTLLVNGDQSAAIGLMTVNAATLGGIGIIGGDVIVLGGTIAPGSNGVGTLTIAGSLSLDSASLLDFEFGEADAVGGAFNDLIEVGGDLVLDGTINVTEPAGGSFDPGIYRVINYSGSLTDNGLDLGTLPVDSDVLVQTSVANQVNLVYGTDPGTDPGDGDPVLNFWDGEAGPKFNDAIDGGDGLWQNPSGNDNWTTAAGDVNAPWTDSAFAIFTATPGTVTVDNSLGGVSASGMQFAVDGYTITGDTLTLVGPEAIVRVGDGTAAGADMTATIETELSGSSQLVKADLGTLVLTGDSSGYAGSAQVTAGTLAVNGSLGGMMEVLSGGRLEGIGQVGATVNHAGGTIAPGFGDIGILTIAGNYTGNGGALEIEAVLGGDNSPADMLVVGGDTSGTTPITVINRGGLGAQTNEGIKIIDVAGVSDGTFTLVGDYVFEGQQAVVAGAYAYRLYQNGIADPEDGDWYLRSVLFDGSGGSDGPGGPLYQPGVPLYEAYSQTLLALNSLPTLQKRVGNRQWAQSDSGQPNGIWGRIEGIQLRPEARLSTSGTDLDIDSFEIQVGIDRALVEQADGGMLIAGITGHYGRAQGDVSSLSGRGRVKTQAYGFGATLTWYGSEGFYVDGQARLTWFDSDLRSSTLGSLIDGNDGRGEAASLEAGKRIGIGRNLTITPQAQAIYSNVRFDRFTDPFEAEVAHGKGDSLRTRLGVSIDYQGASDDGVPRSHLYGIVNVTYEWLDGTRADVGGVPLVHANERLWGELGLGGSVRLSNGLTLYGEVSTGTPLADFGDGYSLQGTAGLRMQF